MSRRRTDDDGALVLEITRAIASAAGTEPGELDTPLYDVVDTEALERVLHSDSLNHVAFEYEDYVVEIDELGALTVTEDDDVSVRDSIVSFN